MNGTSRIVTTLILRTAGAACLLVVMPAAMAANPPDTEGDKSTGTIEMQQIEGKWLIGKESYKGTMGDG